MPGPRDAARRGAQGAARLWSGFWFAPQAPTTWVVFRVGLAAVTLAWALSLGPDLMAFFSLDGLLPDPRSETDRVGLLHWWSGDASVRALHALLLAAAGAVLVGFRVRVAAPLAWVCVVSFQHRNPMLWNAGDVLLRLFWCYAALHALAVGSLGPALFGRRGGGPSPVWGLRLVQLQTTAVYAFSLWDKLRGESWWDGTAVPRALALLELRRFPVPAFVTEVPAAGALLTWGTLALEALLPFLLWWPRTRLVAIALGLALHAAFDYALEIGVFSWVMALGCLAFLPPRRAAAPARTEPAAPGRGP